jgi:hypothetical protein
MLALTMALFSAGCERPVPDNGSGGDLWYPHRDGVVCGESVCPMTKCHANVRCAPNGIECIWEPVNGLDDSNHCTRDYCDPETGTVWHVQDDPYCLDV